MMQFDSKKAPLTYISLFSSAGVGCYGFKLEGFECIATNEIIERRLNVQRHNNKCRYESGYIADDITKLETKEKIRKELEFWKRNHGVKEVDVLISTLSGMSVANHKKGDELARNSWLLNPSSVDEIGPKFFLLENVRAFLNSSCTDVDGKSKKIRQAIRIKSRRKYNIHYQVVNFKDYGNPSSRTRTIVLGVRKDMQEITPMISCPACNKKERFVKLLGTCHL